VRTIAAIGAALALLWAAGAGASAPAPPSDERHLLLVPATPAGTAALARTDARTVARYEAFSLVEASADDDRRLRAAGADRRDDMRTVQTAAGAIDPVVERASLAAKGAPDRDEALALVQFVGPPKDAWLERLRATGASLVTYQAENAYVVHARGDAVERLAALQGSDPAVRAVTALTAADKLQDRTSASGVFAVTTVAGAAGADARAESGTEDAPIRLGALRSDRLALSPAEVARLAEGPGVVAVEAYAAPELHDERGAQIVAGNLTAPAFTLPAEPPAYGDWLESHDLDEQFDFAIDVTDTGLDTGANPSAHPDFADRLAYVNDYSDDPDARDCVGHGTNVASIAAGRSASTGSAYEDAQGFDHGLGVAPYARVGASKIFSCTGAPPSSFSPGTIASTAYAAGARISNNSWGSDAKGDYTLVSAIYDALVRDASPSAGLQQMVEVVSAGNEGDDGYGSTGDLGSAKNVISVGAAESVRASGTDGCGATDAAADSARDIATFSGRGPTDDGRRKPDLVAPGTHIVGAAPQHAGYNAAGVCTKYLAGTTWYSVASGTSQAAPHVSGAAALVRRWSQRTRGAAPSPALTKALLVNTATDLAGGQNGKGDAIAAGPGDDQGWGRVNVGTVFDGTQRDIRDQVLQERMTATGDRRTRTYSVDDTAAPVKVTLAWTDPPGPTTGDPVVNDLDLVVVAGGRTYKGNVFDGAYSRTGGSADPRNNVESVHLPAGTSGRFAVSIVGTSIAGDGVPIDVDETDQDFALVVSNGQFASAPVLFHDAATVDDLGDRDGALEPGERFTLAERLGNAGAGAAGTSGTLAGGANLTITQPTSEWAALAAGATGVNATPLAGTLASGAPCGADVAATLTLTLSGGPQTVPLTLPTGAAGAPVGSTRTLSPRLAIPDDAAAGITSTIDVPEAGLIKDVDVRIGDLDHDWVGDLRIELVAPDGTAVTLADHPGGPDNGGDDFAGTVFDDEAATSIAAGTAPYTGRFRPQNDQLSRLDGKQQQGTWTLRVRDLARGNAGTLGAWGTDTSPATCSIAAITTVASGPAAGSTVSDRDTEFAFGADTGGASFECRLDGAAFAPCTSPKAYAGLADGSHTFDVRAIVGPTTDPTPASRTWTIDATAPAPAVTAPVDGVTIRGTAGTAAGDADAVTVTVYEGATAVRTMQATRDAAGAWSAAVSPALPPGDYTVRAEQADASTPANVGLSAAVAFRIAPPPEPPPNPGPPPPPPPAPPAEQPSPPAEAPSFLLAPADAAADRLTVLAACASACEVRASLGRLGAGRASLATAGTAAVRVRLNARGRAALRRRAAVRASLRVTLLAGRRPLTLSGPVTIRRKATVGRRLRLWAVCSETCPMSATVRTARGVVAKGRTVAGPGPATRLDVRFARPARRGRAVLEAVAGGEVTRAVTLGVRLR
jgi:subtilisin-like proprotein convertase family protein/subtilisin family serine protease